MHILDNLQFKHELLDIMKHWVSLLGKGIRRIRHSQSTTTATTATEEGFHRWWHVYQ